MTRPHHAKTLPCHDGPADPAPTKNGVSMTYATHTDQGIVIVTPGLPRLDASAAADLRAALLAPLDTGASALVLDLTQVGFLDSSALGAMIAGAKRCRPGRFAVAGVQPAVAKLFALTHMDRVFALHPSPGDAIAHFIAE